MHNDLDSRQMVMARNYATVLSQMAFALLGASLTVKIMEALVF